MKVERETTGYGRNILVAGRGTVDAKGRQGKAGQVREGQGRVVSEHSKAAMDQNPKKHSGPLTDSERVGILATGFPSA